MIVGFCPFPFPASLDRGGDMVISCTNGVKWDREEQMKRMGRVKLSCNHYFYFGFKKSDGCI